ncbi:MAG: ribosome biogenesis GTP-binding protein YihA/YsxC [Verrucomicrobia bacterium]|nr:ribosome biogenesis GTP-binding protein YihA/YsxC [Verrucomicrobiota bacterium]MBU6445908.1 ribosome biogenesis GTP-binding protein YihA/YsxC [Verrucomicrobiota bacterium]MDE3047743.1 YihA family ribosome biogenesis GTP-binding protein [Verrucomicrobiota bacterium]
MKARYLLSTLSDFPSLKDPRGTPLPEVALAGRSNVGKSSLINHLFGQKNVAKTSATPGKTQLINFFAVDETFLMVDLPGYGFAKAPLEAVQKWSSAIDAYLNNRPTLKLILLLVDVRREMCREDLQMMEWAHARQIPLLLILTKTDKLNRSEKADALKKYPEAILYTTMTPSASKLLQKKIEAILWD